MAGRPRAEKKESWPDVPRTMAKLLDSARDQRECLVGTAGKRVDGAEDCGDQRYSDGDLPRSAEVEASLEDPRPVCEISSTKGDAAKIKQRDVQRDWMIGRVGELHG